MTVSNVSDGRSSTRDVYRDTPLGPRWLRSHTEQDRELHALAGAGLDAGDLALAETITRRGLAGGCGTAKLHWELLVRIMLERSELDAAREILPRALLNAQSWDPQMLALWVPVSLGFFGTRARQSDYGCVSMGGARCAPSLATETP